MAMRKKPPTQLVLELAGGVTYVNGEEVDLNRQQFMLLAALAGRVGEAVSKDDLMQAVWGQDAQWTTKDELYVLMTKLRRRIDGETKFGQNIRNRRGFGYELELPPDEVLVVDHLAFEPIDEAPTEEVGSAPNQIVSAPPQTPVDDQLARPSSSSRRTVRVASAAALAATLLLGSWSVGYVLSNRRSTAPQSSAPQEVAEKVTETPLPTKEGKESKKTPRDQKGRGSKKKQQPRRKARNQGSDGETVIAAGGTSIPPDAGSSVPDPSSDSSSGSNQGSGKDPDKASQDEAVAPSLPPAPTRYLYHLVSRETGDHFVTTDRNTASEYEAKGYEGGAFARVYTYQEEGTKPISTNQGTAYIFASSPPKTEPAVRTMPLWYSTNDAGDFFYTTSESEAKQDGWVGSVVGYVGAP